jgi:hypothetical protein
MKTKELLWNKYSQIFGIGLASAVILTGVFNKQTSGKIAGNAVYVGLFGIIVGTVVYSLKNNQKPVSE